MNGRRRGFVGALRKRLFGDPDATVQLRRGRPLAGRWTAIAIGVAAALLAGGTGVWLGLRPARHAAIVAALDFPAADEARLLALPVSHTTLYRFAPAPRIVVALFPSMHEQAVTLNRVAVFVEYGPAPRTRVLDDTALHAIIARGGQQFDSFYDGHDYRAADLARFFATANADDVALNESERRLHAAIGGLSAGFGALISLPPLGEGPQDAPGRAAILRHELSHGLYFTDATYAGLTASFWQNVLTADERAGFRRFLGGSGYDTANDDLMRNETQAYLVHTRDPRFFYPAVAGLNASRAVSLRAAFVAGMPAGWLRDRTQP